jgi:hypothetical protein
MLERALGAGALALGLSMVPATADAQVGHGPSAVVAPAPVSGSPWSVSAQVELGVIESGGELEVFHGELGLRLSRRVAPGWRLGLALSRQESAYDNLRETYFDLGIERSWDLNERVRLVAFGGPSAGSILADEELLDQGNVFGLHGGFATEILFGKVVLRPEIRQRFLNAEHDAFDDAGPLLSLGLGFRF